MEGYCDIHNRGLEFKPVNGRWVLECPDCKREGRLDYLNDYKTLLTTKDMTVNVTLPDDPVNHPSHYTQGKIECIDFIQDKKMNFCRGNAIKYIVRAGLKDPSKEVEDLKKAVFYLNKEIERLEEGK